MLVYRGKTNLSLYSQKKSYKENWKNIAEKKINRKKCNHKTIDKTTRPSCLNRTYISRVGTFAASSLVSDSLVSPLAKKVDFYGTSIILQLLFHFN